MSVVVFSSACFSFSAALFSEDQLSILGMAGWLDSVQDDAVSSQETLYVNAWNY